MSDRPEDLVASVTFDAGLPTLISNYLGTDFNRVFTERLNAELSALQQDLVRKPDLKSSYRTDVRYQLSLFIFNAYILAADTISTIHPLRTDPGYHELLVDFEQHIMTRGWVSLEGDTPVVHIHFVRLPEKYIPENVNAYLLNTTPTLMRLN